MTKTPDDSTTRPTRSWTGSRILVAEDNKDVSFMICETLRAHIGCDVIAAMDGKECVTIAGEEEPDVILLDVHMPEMNGFDVCRILKGKERTKRIPIMFLTATADDIKSRIKGLEIGADDYLVQPVDDLELITRVKVMIRLKRLIDRAESAGSSLSQLPDTTFHKLRSPLNSILGMAELIQKPFFGPLTEKQKQFAQTISKCGRQLLTLINDLEDG